MQSKGTQTRRIELIFSMKYKLAPGRPVLLTRQGAVLHYRRFVTFQITEGIFLQQSRALPRKLVERLVNLFLRDLQ